MSNFTRTCTFREKSLSEKKHVRACGCGLWNHSPEIDLSIIFERGRNSFLCSVTSHSTQKYTLISRACLSFGIFRSIFCLRHQKCPTVLDDANEHSTILSCITNFSMSNCECGENYVGKCFLLDAQETIFLPNDDRCTIRYMKMKVKNKAVCVFLVPLFLGDSKIDRTTIRRSYIQKPSLYKLIKYATHFSMRLNILFRLMNVWTLYGCHINIYE